MPEPRADRRRPQLPLGGREMFRYEKSSRTRAYNITDVSDDTAELWVISETRGKLARSRKLAQFEDPHDVNPFLQEIERELRLGGWSKCP